MPGAAADESDREDKCAFLLISHGVLLLRRLRRFYKQSLPGNHVVGRSTGIFVAAGPGTFRIDLRPKDQAIAPIASVAWPRVRLYRIGYLIVVIAIDPDNTSWCSPRIVVLSHLRTQRRIPITRAGFAASLTSGGEIKTIWRVLRWRRLDMTLLRQYIRGSSTEFHCLLMLLRVKSRFCCSSDWILAVIGVVRVNRVDDLG